MSARMRGILAFAGRTVAWMVILAASAVILAAVVVPRIAGATPYTIITGSMSPLYPPGTLIVVQPVPVDSLQVGDVVTVQLVSGEPAVVTHRISALAYELDGGMAIETKGDANPSADRELRVPEQIRGKLWYSVPYIGYVSTALTGGERQWIVTLIAVGLIVYAASMFIGSWRSRRRRNEQSASTREHDDEDAAKAADA